jgi:hypothetical protein
MEVVRALSTCWPAAVRFRNWLVEMVFHAEPQVGFDQARWGKIVRWRQLAEADLGILREGCDNGDEWREWRWGEELKSRPKTMLQ